MELTAGPCIRSAFADLRARGRRPPRHRPAPLRRRSTQPAWRPEPSSHDDPSGHPLIKNCIPQICIPQICIPQIESAFISQARREPVSTRTTYPTATQRLDGPCADLATLRATGGNHHWTPHLRLNGRRQLHTPEAALKDPHKGPTK